MSGELIVKNSPQDMSTLEVITWQVTFTNTFTPSPSAGSVFVYRVTYGEPGDNVTSTMLAAGAASAANGTITAPAMYGSAGTAGQVYKMMFVGTQGGQRCTQYLYINLKP